MHVDLYHDGRTLVIRTATGREARLAFRRGYEVEPVAETYRFRKQLRLRDLAPAIAAEHRMMAAIAAGDVDDEDAESASDTLGALAMLELLAAYYAERIESHPDELLADAEKLDPAGSDRTRGEAATHHMVQRVLATPAAGDWLAA